MSLRYVGTETSNVSLLSQVNANPRLVKIVYISLTASCVPSILLMRENLHRIFLSLKGLSLMSMIPLAISPPASSVIIAESLSRAMGALLGSVPRSKRRDASVWSANDLLVRRIELGSKYADSRRTFVVAFPTSEFFPPIMPAIAIGFSLSQMRRDPFGRLRSTLSRVMNFSSRAADLTTILCPSILS